MSRPPLEVADIIRVAGDSFFDSSRNWLTWLHLKVINAILRCRTPVAIWMSVPPADIAPSPSIRVATGTARSARPTLATAGWKRAAATFCRSAMSTSYSLCHTNWLRWRCRTNAKSTPCYFVLLPTPCCKSPATRAISAPRLDSSACSIPGISNCCIIRMSTA